MKRQFVLIRTIRRTKIPVLLDSWVTNTTRKMFRENKGLSFIFK